MPREIGTALDAAPMDFSDSIVAQPKIIAVSISLGNFQSQRSVVYDRVSREAATGCLLPHVFPAVNR